jgi:hypothetical protein
LDRNGALNVLGESMSDLSKTHIPLNATTPEKMSELIKLILGAVPDKELQTAL